jgi:predicted Zn-dependent peptidase
MTTKHGAASRTLLAAAALLLLPAAGADAGQKAYQKIKAPKLRDIVSPPVTRETLANGIQVFVVEDHELPLFRLSLTMKAGGFCDPAEQVGLAEITANVLRSGGSEVLPGDRMDEVLEGMGGAIETSGEALATSVSVNVLIEDSDKALTMLRDLLLHPAYPDDKLDLEIKQWRSAIARRNDDPGGIAQREVVKILYGPDHPLSRNTEYAHLARIRRDDLVRFHRTYYQPQDAFLTVWGDFDTAAMLERVRDVLGEWPRGNATYPEVPPVPETSASINLATKTSVNQSTILIGHRGTTQKDPDFYALSVMSEILGGGFGSRLFNEVRSTKGLAYSVGSSLGAGLAYPGMFMVRCGTKSETTAEAVRACIDEVRKMKTQPITPAELERAKASILNSHVFNFTSRGQIVNRQASFVRWGYPSDFLDQYQRGIEAVTLEQVSAAAGKYLQPDRVAILVVGNPEKFDAPLSGFGSVNAVDITIPEPPAAAAPVPEATPETRARGKTVLAAAARAHGGLTALAAVRDLTEQATVTLSAMGQSLPGKMLRYRKYPGQVRSEIEIMGQRMVQAFSSAANAGFQSAGGQSGDFDAAQIQEAKDEMAQDFVVYLRDPDPYRPQWIGEADVRGAVADVVLMSPPSGRTFKVFVDRGTQRIVKQESRGKNLQGAPVAEEVFYEDYRRAPNGVQLPHRVTLIHDGEPFLSSETTSLTWDAIPAAKFTKSES